ncbi:MAG: hypothetical protein LBK25_01860 [Treponema sp.]|nr:hypothetical protein [Treponema sp.]
MNDRETPMGGEVAGKLRETQRKDFMKHSHVFIAIMTVALSVSCVSIKMEEEAGSRITSMIEPE